VVAFSASLSGVAHAAASLLTDEQASFLAFSMGTFPEDLFVVRGFSGREGISETFEFDIELLASLDEDLLQAMSLTVLRQRGCLRLALPGMPGREVHGVVSRFRVVAVDPAVEQVRLRVTLVPSFWLAGHQTRSRIFQDMRVEEIVNAVLADWKINVSWKLREPLSHRTYCTQYRETDLAFVERLLAEEGVYYFFDQPSLSPEGMLGSAGGAISAGLSVAGGVAGAVGGKAADLLGQATDLLGMLSSEIMVLCDHVEAYPPLRDGSLLEAVTAGAGALLGSAGVPGKVVELLAPSPELTFDARTDLPREDCVYVFSPAEQAMPEAVLVRDYDFRRPFLEIGGEASTARSVRDAVQSTLEGAASASLHASIGTGGISVTGAANLLKSSLSANVPSPVIDPLRFRFYQHDDLPEDEAHAFAFEADTRRARYTLEQLRREAKAAEGRSWCHRLEAGRRFRLDGHPLGWLNGEHVVTRVLHHFDRDTLQASGDTRADGTSRAVYFNEFTSVPASVRFRPVVPTRPLRQVTETALTVGPPGEEIYVDNYGRIKVQFHWDLEGGRNDHSSCFVRTMMGWAGPGFGNQFIPRIGMEVLVTFLNGNPDRPLVVGCVPNEHNPLPFALPDDKTRSGFKTRSSLGGQGFNELSFEDLAGAEQIHLRAQRNFDGLVLNDHNHVVGRDETRQVGHDQETIIRHDQRLKVEHDRFETVVGDLTRQVDGQETVTITKNLNEHVIADRTVHIDGRDERVVTQETTETMKDDLTFRIEGCFTTIVGKNDAKRSAALHVEGSTQLSSVEATEIVSDKRLILRCGESQILIGPKSIELQSPSIFLRAKDASLDASAGKLTARGKDAVHAFSDRIGLKSKSASLMLSSNALLDGQKVKLNCGPDNDDDKLETETKPPTVIIAKDKKGKPLPHARFLVLMSDGTEVSGVADKDGKAELDLPADGKVTFPELSDVE